MCVSYVYFSNIYGWVASKKSVTKILQSSATAGAARFNGNLSVPVALRRTLFCSLVAYNACARILGTIPAISCFNSHIERTEGGDDGWERDAFCWTRSYTHRRICVLFCLRESPFCISQSKTIGRRVFAPRNMQPSTSLHTRGAKIENKNRVVSYILCFVVALRK